MAISVLSVPVQMKKLFPVQDGNTPALLSGRSLFRCCLSGTTFLLTSNTAVPYHSSELLLKEGRGEREGERDWVERESCNI